MKKKTFYAFLMMIAGIFLLSYFTLWWLPAIWVILIAYVMKLNIKAGMTTGGISFVLVWVAYAMYMSAQDNANIISKTGSLLGGLSQSLMVVIVLVLSLITGILSGWLGSAIATFSNGNASQG